MTIDHGSRSAFDAATVTTCGDVLPRQARTRDGDKMGTKRRCSVARRPAAICRQRYLASKTRAPRLHQRQSGNRSLPIPPPGAHSSAKPICPGRPRHHLINAAALSCRLPPPDQLILPNNVGNRRQCGIASCHATSSREISSSSSHKTF